VYELDMIFLFYHLGIYAFLQTARHLESQKYRQLVFWQNNEVLENSAAEFLSIS
jgi:hypothetical protein